MGKLFAKIRILKRFLEQLKNTVMKNVKNAGLNKKNLLQTNYWQIDHKIKSILNIEGAIIVPSSKAWEKYSWTRKYFSKKPKEGYFIWIKKEIDFPLFTCFSIASLRAQQNLENLLIIEKNLRVHLIGNCNALKKNLNCTHRAKGKIILKEGACLRYEHNHSWGKDDLVEPEYQFFLGKNAKLNYNYKNLLTPNQLTIKTDFHLLENASLIAKVIVDAFSTTAVIKDNVYLEGRDSSGEIQLKIVGRSKSQIEARSQIIAQAPARGHLDCQGLLSDKNAMISLVPHLVCQNKDAQLTHEASLGKISAEALNYLRQRGFSQKEATDLIINGFLGK